MTYREFWQPLTARYDEGEAKAITRLVAEVRYGLTLADVLAGRLETVDEHQLSQLQQRLLAGEPVQYVLGEAQFLGRWFHVEPGVLIPRPETEELVQHILASTPPASWQGAILDIGTGSGCIAITLAAELPHAHVAAWDISDKALAIATNNARRHLPPPGGMEGFLPPLGGIEGGFLLVDALHPPLCDHDCWDIIVSNPPYVCEEEKTQMEAHVLDYEPHEALFVPDDDPLLFYRSIGRYALQALKPGGRLFFELNARHAHATATLLQGMGFQHVDIICDQYGKDRFIKTCK